MQNENQNGKQEWVYCPVCGNKTRLRLRKIQFLRIFHYSVQNVKKESLIDAKEYVVKRNKNKPDAKTQCGIVSNTTIHIWRFYLLSRYTRRRKVK